MNNGTNLDRKRGEKFEVEFKDGSKVELYMRRPVQKEIFNLDMTYRVAMTHLMKAGVPTVHKLTKILEENEEWTGQDENNMNNYNKRIVHYSNQLKQNVDERNDKENLELIDKLYNWRIKHLELIGRKFDLFENSCERQAEQRKLLHYVSLCCNRQDNDKPYFKDIDDYEKLMFEDNAAASRILSAAYAFEYGADIESFAKEWVEIDNIKRKIEESQKASTEEDVKESDANTPKRKKLRRKKKKSLN